MSDLSEINRDDCEKEDNRKLIHRLQDMLLSAPEEDKLDLPVKHHFAKDTYGRELFLPAGSLIVGKIHKHSSLNILAQGSIILVTEDGRQDLTAPYTIASQPGIKRVIYALEDTTWVTVHGTDETDVEKIEKEFIAKDYSEVAYLEKPIKGDLCLGSQ